MKDIFTIFRILKKIFLLNLLLALNLIAQTLDPTLKLLSPIGYEYWTNGSLPRITWKSSNLTIIKIEISIDAGITWETITSATIANVGFYSKWQVNNIESNECLIKISKFDNPDIFDISDSFFKIASDTTSQKLIVLGSSTAAGVGPSSIDSSWVVKYKNYIFEKNTTMKIVNLAVGGYTTYDIMMDGFFPILDRPLPDEAHNISKALTYNPKAIIINLPSNDVNLGFSISEQLSNYDSILALADLTNIPVWVSTTQPRNFSQLQIEKQIEMRDSTFSKFGEKTLDFWTDIADSNGRILSKLDSGDGIHLNDIGHEILFQRVLAAKIFDPAIVAVEKTKDISDNFELMQNYPNPFNPTTTIKYNIPNNVDANFSSNITVKLKVYDLLGREVKTLVNENQSPGAYEVLFDASALSSGVYFYRLESVNFIQTKKLMLVK